MLARAQLLAQIREFFQHRQVLEVETPLLAPCTVSDPYMRAVYVEQESGWLQTSPEFAMKRLLAAGSGDIYQICKSFRGAEQGRHHALEFTLLEWYRLNFDDRDLIDETAQLLCLLLATQKAEQISYADLFAQTFACDPHSASVADLKALTLAHNIECFETDRSGLLDLLFSHSLQPELQPLTFVYDYPECQAALARVARDECNRSVARRFECFYKGVELGNGYHELLSADDYCQRHAADNAVRTRQGVAEIEYDARFLAAMEHGLPDCAGIAIGLDRVLMLAQQQDSIAAVMSFAKG